MKQQTKPKMVQAIRAYIDEDDLKLFKSALKKTRISSGSFIRMAVMERAEEILKEENSQ